jgi:hypothetical protein
VALANADATELVIRVVNFGAARNLTITLQNVISPTTVDISYLQGVTGSDYEQVVFCFQCDAYL